MIIESTSTSISFVPFVDFSSISSVTIEVWHKETKKKDSSTENVSMTDSVVTIPLPTLTNVTAQANHFDELLIRVFNGTSLVWEYVARWKERSMDINDNTEQWNQTSVPNQAWIKF